MNMLTNKEILRQISGIHGYWTKRYIYNIYQAQFSCILKRDNSIYSIKWFILMRKVLNQCVLFVVFALYLYA